MPGGARHVLAKCRTGLVMCLPSAGRGLSCYCRVPDECGALQDGACDVLAKCRTGAGQGLSRARQVLDEACRLLA